MTALATERTSAAKAGWIIGLFFLGWLAFLFGPLAKSGTKEVRPVVTMPPSKLRAVGLPDNPDLDGLPELFAVFSESAEWKGDRTQFAYWHPTNRAYSYFFEAIRKNGKIRFRPISKAEALASKAYLKDGVYYKADPLLDASQTAETIFESESPTHPFVFFHSLDIPRIHVPPRPPSSRSFSPVQPPVSVPIDLPKPDGLQPPVTIPVNRVPQSPPSPLLTPGAGG